MNIAFFADNFYPEMSGISDSTALIGKELGKLGHEVHFFVPFYSPKNYKFVGLKDEEINLGPNIFVHRVPSFPIPMPTLQGRVVFPNWLRATFEKEKFDIVHTHSFWGPGIDARSLAKKQKIPFIGTNHTPIEIFSPVNIEFVKSFLKKYVIRFFNKCDFVTTPSEVLLNSMKAQGLKPESTVVSNPIEMQFYKENQTKEALKKELGFAGFTVLYAGRISEEKRVDTIIDAFKDFSKNKNGVTLVLVGEGSLRKKFEKIVKESGKSNQIKFIGPYLGDSKKDLYDIFHASDIFVIASIFETQSMVTLQAMASGLPVIASNVGALPDIVNSERGLLFDVGNSIQMAEQLEVMYSNPEMRDKFGKNGRTFSEKYSAEKVAKEWEKIYNNVIEKFNQK